MTSAARRAALLRRLPPGREDLGPVGLYERYWAPAGLQSGRVLTLLDLLELEYDLPVGLCRPEDRLRPLFAPAAGPLDELLWARGARPAADPETLDDLVRAWCGSGG